MQGTLLNEVQADAIAVHFLLEHTVLAYQRQNSQLHR